MQCVMTADQISPDGVLTVALRNWTSNPLAGSRLQPWPRCLLAALNSDCVTAPLASAAPYVAHPFIKLKAAAPTPGCLVASSSTIQLLLAVEPAEVPPDTGYDVVMVGLCTFDYTCQLFCSYHEQSGWRTLDLWISCMQ